MIQLSIIIPCVGSQTSFEDTLLSVLENRPDRTEIIVPCQSDYVDPYNLDDEVIFLHCGQQAEVVNLLNSGIKSSQGEIIHWIQPGHQARPNWAEIALKCFAERAGVSAVAPIILDRKSQKILSAGVSYLDSGGRKVIRRGRKRNTIFRAMGPSFSAGFYRRHVLDASNGFSNWTGSELADADLASLMYAADCDCVVDPDCVLLGDKTEASQGFSSARRLERLYWKQSQRPNAKRRLLAHLARITWYSAVRFPRWSMVSTAFGRLAGMLDARKNPENARDVVKRMKSSNKNSPTEFEHRRAA